MFAENSRVRGGSSSCEISGASSSVLPAVQSTILSHRDGERTGSIHVLYVARYGGLSLGEDADEQSLVRHYQRRMWLPPANPRREYSAEFGSLARESVLNSRAGVFSTHWEIDR